MFYDVQCVAVGTKNVGKEIRKVSQVESEIVARPGSLNCLISVSVTIYKIHFHCGGIIPPKCNFY